MKKIIVLIILTITFIISSEVNIAQTSCYTGNCDTWNEYYAVPIRLPLFSDCDIFIDYKVRICNGEMQIYIVKLWYSPENCPEMAYCIYPLWPNENVVNWECVKIMFNQAYAQLTEKVFNDITGQWSDEQKDEYLCGGQSFIQVSYSRGSCSQWCIYEVDIFGNRYSKEIPCDDQVCCKTITKYCWEKVFDPQTQQYVYYSSILIQKISDPVDCSEFTPQQVTCPFGMSDCKNICD